MPAQDSPPTPLAIIAGGGVLPHRLAGHCEARGGAVFIVGFDGHTDPTLMEGRAHLWARLGGAGTIVAALKERGISDIVLIGSIKRPHWKELRPDLYTAAFFARLGLKALGDDGLLRAVRALLEEEGFTLHGLHEILGDILMPEGLVGAVAPGAAHEMDIATGLRAARYLGELDIGQAVVVQDGVVLGVEGAEGTDELLRRCASYRRTAKGGVLVKACKPGQDRKLDLPTIGPDTVKLCAALGFDGIAAEAGAVLLADGEAVRHAADYDGLFVVGVKG